MPVCLSPMMSSRCPRPMGKRASMTSSPVSVDGIAERVHHPAEKAFAHGNARRFPRALHGAPRRDLAAVAEHDHAAALPLQILHHSLHAAGKLHDLAVCHAVQPAHHGDAVPHGKHFAEFLRLGGGIPLFHGGAQQRDDVPLIFGYGGERAFQLGESALRAPIVHVVPRAQAEAAGIFVALHPFEFRGRAVSAFQKFLKPLFLALARAFFRKDFSFHLFLPACPRRRGRIQRRRPHRAKSPFPPFPRRSP